MPPVNRNKPRRCGSSTSQYSLMEFMREFPDDATCLQWLWRNRYSKDGKHARCTKCAKQTVFERYETTQQRQSWTCTACGNHLHPTAGTIFHKSSTSLHLWFYAMYLMTSTRCGISAKQIERELGVTYKTAWRMTHLIRKHLMQQGDAPFDNGQPYECDETYIGGKERFASGRPGPTNPLYRRKTAVFGIVQRKGKVAAIAVPDVKGDTVFPYIQQRALQGSTIHTDDYNLYRSLTKLGYKHERIKHSQYVYVSGDVHTNTIEGFWSLVKRGINGVFHAVSKKHLQGYLNEYAWRYNHRADGKAQFEQLLLRAASGN